MKRLFCFLLASFAPFASLPPPPSYFPSHGATPQEDAREREKFKKTHEQEKKEGEEPVDIHTRGPVEGYYLQPGMVGVANGQWSGSDNLYNLPANLSVIVEIHYNVLENDEAFPVAENKLRKIVEDIFSTERIKTKTSPGPTKAYLPFFHVLVLVTPIEQGFAVLCAGRLFEEVQLYRVRPTNGVIWQAITWERQALIAASANKTAETVSKAVENIANDFASQYRYFSGIK